jgi:hypothetical protein
MIHSHAIGIEAFIHEHVGMNQETGEYGRMYFDRTLEDWISFRITDRTKFDLTISSGLALLSIQSPVKEKKVADLSSKVFFRRVQVQR